MAGWGNGIPIRTTVTDFGPLLLSKVPDLNETQESSVGLIFHRADTRSLALLDLKDLQSTITCLISDEAKNEFKGIGGLSSDGRRLISALELPAVQDRPALFSMFLMWLLADLFPELPEVGDQDKPKLVFIFDEAHLLFTDAWTRLRAPLSSMTPAPDPTILATVSASPSQARYGAAVDRESADELLTKRMATIDAEQAKAEADAAAAKEQTQGEHTTSSRSSRDPGGFIETVVKSSGFNSFLRSAGTVLGREITRTIFGTRSR